MTQFWLATVLFLLLGLTPLAVATAMNRRDRRTPTPTSQEPSPR